MDPAPNRTIQELQESVPHISIVEAQQRIAAGAHIIDVREMDEAGAGTVTDALIIPLGEVQSRLQADIQEADTPIILYCETGVRSLYATQWAIDLGYTNVASMDGGYSAWKRAGLPIDYPQPGSAAESARYSRHLRIPEIGIDGQQKLLDSKVLLIGAGGLGSPAGLYLAAAGIGTLGIVDDDVVDISNLHRQVLHRTADIGIPKVESASRTMTGLNPDVHVVQHQFRLTEENVDDVFSKYDLVVDGSDNFETRYIVNDACVRLGIPQVHGSIFRFDGQITTFDPRQDESPCYRCLFPSPPPPELAPNCAVAGVLGVLPGVVGTIQATEAIKLVLGIGEPLVGRLLMYDALSMNFRTLKVRRDKSCPSCGAEAHQRRATQVAK